MLQSEPLHTTLNSKRKYTLWVSVGKYSKSTSCRNYERVWGIAHWSSTPNKTDFVKKFQVVPNFWIKVWGYALYQPVTQKSMAETDFCEHSYTTSQRTFPQNFGTIWNFFTNSGLIVRELWLAVPQNCRGSSSGYILSTHWETKCILSFGAGCTNTNDMWLDILYFWVCIGILTQLPSNI